MRVDAIKNIGDAVEVRAIPPVLDFDRLTSLDDQRRTKILAMEEDRIEPTERGVSQKYRRRKLHELSVEELIEVAYARLIEERQRKDIAEDFRISIGLVSRIASKAKVGVEFVDDKK